MDTLLSNINYWLVPLVTVVLTIFVRGVSRNDRHGIFKKEDFAIGMDLSLVSIVLVVGYTARIAALRQDSSIREVRLEWFSERLSMSPWVILILVIGLWATSTLIRNRGWDAQHTRNLKFGIVIPNVIGFAFLLIAVYWLGQPPPQ